MLLTTELARRLDPADIIGTLMMPFMAVSDKGARTVVWAATDPALASVTGAYLKSRRVIAAGDRANDPQTAQRLWQIACQLTGMPHD